MKTTRERVDLFQKVREETFSWLVKNSIFHLLIDLKLSYLHSYLPPPKKRKKIEIGMS